MSHRSQNIRLHGNNRRVNQQNDFEELFFFILDQLLFAFLESMSKVTNRGFKGQMSVIRVEVTSGEVVIVHRENIELPCQLK